jgi:hypothetical protein
MTAKTKTVKKKPTAPPKKKPTAKKLPVKKSPPKPISKPGKKKPGAKPDVKPAAAAKADPRKAGAAKAPSARDLAYAGAAQLEAQERGKKAPKVRPSRSREPGKRPDLPLPTPVERPGIALVARGEKYVCFKCRAKFYDLGKPEPICPKCGANQREAPRQVRPKMPPPVAAVPDSEAIEDRPVKRSRLLDEDEDEIVVDTDADAPDDDLDLGLGVGDEGEDFGSDEPEEEEEEEAT